MLSSPDYQSLKITLRRYYSSCRVMFSVSENFSSGDEQISYVVVARSSTKLEAALIMAWSDSCRMCSSSSVRLLRRLLLIEQLRLVGSKSLATGNTGASYSGRRLLPSPDHQSLKITLRHYNRS